MLFGNTRKMAVRIATVALFASLLLSRGANAAAPDEVLLSNGGRLRGTVMEDDPVKGVSIRLLDGTTRRVTRKEVLKIQYADAAGAAPPAVAPVAVAPVAPVAVAPVAPVDVAPAALAPIAAPGVLPAQPAYGRPAHHPTALWVTGLSLWGATYIATISITAAIGEQHDKGKNVGESAIPFFGPWAILADGGNHPTGAETGGLIASGIVQQLCLAMFVMGVTVKVGGEHTAMTFAPTPVASGGMGNLSLRF